MNILFSVDQKKCLLAGINQTSSTITLDIDPADLNQDERYVLARNLKDGHDARELGAICPPTLAAAVATIKAMAEKDNEVYAIALSAKHADWVEYCSYSRYYIDANNNFLFFGDTQNGVAVKKPSLKKFPVCTSTYFDSHPAIIARRKEIESSDFFKNLVSDFNVNYKKYNAQQDLLISERNKLSAQRDKEITEQRQLAKEKQEALLKSMLLAESPTLAELYDLKKARYEDIISVIKKHVTNIVKCDFLDIDQDLTSRDRDPKLSVEQYNNFKKAEKLSENIDLDYSVSIVAVYENDDEDDKTEKGYVIQIAVDLLNYTAYMFLPLGE